MNIKGISYLNSGVSTEIGFTDPTPEISEHEEVVGQMNFSEIQLRLYANRVV